MFRKILSAATSTAVVAGLATAGVVATAAPAAAVPATNPNLVGCGIPITLVMDASGSISGTEITAMRTASKAFLAGLQDTGSTARIVEFAATSKQLISRRDIAGAGLTQLNAAIDSYKSGGLGTTTNWETALWRTFDEPIPGNKGLVVFLTDGDPNTIGGINGSATSFTTETVAANAAEVYANQLKNAGNRMLGVGIGLSNAGQQDRLKQVTGPTLVNSIPANATINDFDAVVTTNFDDLGNALKRVAVALCGGSVTITKNTDTDTAGTYVPQGGWPFSARVTPGSPGNGYEWTQPAGEPTNTATGTTATVTSPGPPATTKGVVTFQYAPTDLTTRTVRVSEELTGDQANFTPRTNPYGYRCTFNGLNPPGPQQGVMTLSGTTAYFDISLKSDESASCEVFNTRNLAQLKLKKVVTGDNGANGPGAWTLKADAAAPLDGKNFQVPGTNDSFDTVYAGTEYSLSETGPGDYTGTWQCTGATLSGDKVTVAKDGQATCTLTNARDLGQLKLVKKVEGGDQTPDAWTLSAAAAAPLNDKNFTNPGGQPAFKDVYAGTDYTLGETGPGDYSAGDWTCKDDQDNPVSSTGSKVKVTKDQKVTCELTNTRDTAELKLVKKVKGDNGDKAPSDWDLSANAAAPLDDKNFTVKGDADTFKTVYSGVNYDLSESGPGNYTASDWKCENADGPVSADGGTVKLTKNDKVTCELTNDRDLAELKLVKQVEGGSSNADDWTLTAKAAAPLDDRNISTPGGSGTFEKVYSGVNYTLGETGPGNYTASAWECVSDQPDTSAAASQLNPGDTVNLPKNAKVTCTIVNTRDLAQLKLVKQVEGGSSNPDDWTLTAKAAAPDNDKNISTPGGSGTFEEVYSGIDYTLGETGPANYAGLGWECVSEDIDVARSFVQQGDSVNLQKGERVTCTIVNERDLAELKLVKQVQGKNNPNDWTLTAKASAPDDDKNISTPGGSGTFESVYAGTEYTLGETGPGGYSPSDWVCVLNDQEPIPQADGQLNSGDKITFKKGQKVTCTIVNTRDLGSLTIIKEFNPQQSGYTGTFDINYTCVDGADPVKNGTVQLGAGQSTTITGLPTGTVCTVNEPALPANPSGWTFNQPTYNPANGQATVTTKDQTVSVTVVNSVSQVSPVVAKKICPITVTLVKPKPKKVGNRVIVKKIKTKKNSCKLVKPVVLCRPLKSSAAGEKAFCDTKVTKKGKIRVKTRGYDKVKVTVIVRAKPKKGFEDQWKPNTWRKKWILR